MDYLFLDGAVYFPASRTLCVADLHLGYEAELRKRGVHIPSSEYASLRRRLEKILSRIDVGTVVLNGDVKHGIGTISDAEWRQIRGLLKTLQEGRELVVVTGNHDLFLAPVARKESVTLVASHRIGTALFLHGDQEPAEELLEGADTIVIGHEHPALRIREGLREEQMKCYLVGNYRDRKLIVLPSMFGLAHGTDILSSETHSPLLGDLGPFRAYALADGETFYMGTVAELRRRNQ